MGEVCLNGLNRPNRQQKLWTLIRVRFETVCFFMVTLHRAWLYTKSMGMCCDVTTFIRVRWRAPVANRETGSSPSPGHLTLNSLFSLLHALALHPRLSRFNDRQLFHRPSSHHCNRPAHALFSSYVPISHPFGSCLDHPSSLTP